MSSSRLGARGIMLAADRPAAGEIQRKSRFYARTGRFSVKDKAPYQQVRGEIRYAADQWNFLRGSTNLGALTIE
jgi:hypothetical protein